MKALLLILALVSTSQAANPPYWGTIISTATGKATQYLSGSLKVAASSTTAGTTNIQLDGTSGGVDASSFTAVYGVKAATAVYSGNVQAGSFTGPLTGAVTGNAATASALAANGANCSAGSAPLGVDAAGAVEGCATVASQASVDVLGVSTKALDTAKFDKAGGAISGGIALTSGDFSSDNTNNRPHIFFANAGDGDSGEIGSYAPNLFGVGSVMGTNHRGNLFWNTTDDVFISTMGGSVGIGTTTPGAKLDVNGSISASTIVGSTITASNLYSLGQSVILGSGTVTGALGVGGTMHALEVEVGNSGGYGIRTQDNNAKVSLVATTAGGVVFTAGGNNVARVMPGGVAINVASPDTNLHVVGGIIGSTITASTITATQAILGQVNAASGTFRGDLGTLGNLTALTAAVNTSDLFVSGGKVGIGTTSPAAKLDVTSSQSETSNVVQVSSNNASIMFAVKGNGRVDVGSMQEANTPTYQSAVTIISGSGGTSNGPEAVGGIEFPITTNGDYGAKIYSNNANETLGIASRYGSKTWTPRLAVNVNSGNVGIGTTNPLSPLDVAGTASFGAAATKSTMTAAGGAWFTGSVGIGTTAPGVSLDVVGAIRSVNIAKASFDAINGVLGAELHCADCDVPYDICVGTSTGLSGWMAVTHSGIDGALRGCGSGQ